MNCRGMALLTGLVLLAAISLLAITAAGSMTLQKHQAANFADKIQAAANARVAESYALAWLYSRADTERQDNCTDGCLLPVGIHQDQNIPDNPEFESTAWWQNVAVPAGGIPEPGETLAYVATGSMEALWVMEELHFETASEAEREAGYTGVGYYRIFSRGSGTNPTSIAVTERIVARPWGGEFKAMAFPPAGLLSEFCSQFAEEQACGTLAWRQRR